MLGKKKLMPYLVSTHHEEIMTVNLTKKMASRLRKEGAIVYNPKEYKDG